jgi:hypothetical protein
MVPAMEPGSKPLVLLVLCAAAGGGGAQQSASAPAGPSPKTWQFGENRLQAWKEDLAYFAAELAKRHKNPFFQLKKEEFEKRMDDLQASVPKLRNEEVLLRLMQIVSAIGDGHTAVQVNTFAPGWRMYPIKLLWLSDGVYCAAAADPALVGARVLKIGNLETEAALKKVAGVVPIENEWAMRLYPCDYATMSEVLFGLGISESADSVTLRVKTAAGEERDAVVKLAKPGEKLTIYTAFDGKKTSPPLRHKKRDFYWFEPLDDKKAIYICYNKCSEAPAKPFADFAKEVLAEIDAKKPERVVIDYRNNPGGNSEVARPLITGLAERKANVKIAVLTSRLSLSSSLLNAHDLRTQAGAVLLGEPPGQRPNSYGEVRKFELPNSGITISHSTKYFKIVDGDPPTLEPDVRVEFTSKDYFEGKDPVLDAALQR